MQQIFRCNSSFVSVNHFRGVTKMVRWLIVLLAATKRYEGRPCWQQRNGQAQKSPGGVPGLVEGCGSVVVVYVPVMSFCAHISGIELLFCILLRSDCCVERGFYAPTCPICLI